MTFPPPIIPQTVEQAVQRDQIAGLNPVRLDDPRAELERLRQAIREHREAHQGPYLTVDRMPDAAAAKVFLRHGKANLKLWACLEGA